MKEKCEYDERQILERGKAFRRGYISLAVAMLVCFFIKDCFELNFMDDASVMLTCLWVSVVITSVTMIVKNAYEGIYEGRNAIVVSGMGVAGAFVVLTEIIKGLRGNFVFYSDAGAISCGIGLLVIFTVYHVKKRQDRLKEIAREKL